MANIINELSQCLPDVDINSQIIRLSTSEALAAEKQGVMNSMNVIKISLFPTKITAIDESNHVNLHFFLFA